jgi:hypothetical protein
MACSNVSTFTLVNVLQLRIRCADPVLHERLNCLHVAGDETNDGSNLG